MPNRIEHKIVNDLELKWCTKCKQYVSIDRFNKNNAIWDGLEQYCITCSHNRHRTPQWSAMNVYRNLLDRVASSPHYIERGIECRMTREGFVEWYIPRYFVGCLLDRIDNLGHYEIGNIQLISRVEHNHKLRADNLAELGIVEGVGERYCYKCNALKPIDNFGVKSNGIVRQECKQCGNAARNKRWKELKK